MVALTKSREEIKLQRKEYQLANVDKIKARKKVYYEANKEAIKKRMRDYYAANKEYFRRRNKEYRAANKEQARERGRRRQGLPIATYPAPDDCECCGTPAWLLGRALHLDHDHITGRFRGWLCSNCNTGIGKLGDNADGLLKALKYIQRTQCKS